MLNGAGFAYVGPFTVQAGDTVGWGVVLSGRVGRSGTITVTNAGSGAGLAVIHYQVLTSGNGLQ